MQSNGFADVHVAFRSGGEPRYDRLGNSWSQIGAATGSVWVGTANGGPNAQVESVTVPGWRLWASGDVFSYRSRNQDPLARFADDLAVGRADPALLDAHAVVFGWEEGSRCLHVWTDRMGTVHAYYGGSPASLSVGTVMGAVAEGSSRDLDWVGITGFCGFGFYPGDRTMFTDVRILRPATWTVLDERGALVSERRYWDWWYDPTERSDDELVDEFHDIWTRTIRDQIGDRQVVVPISGGLDSRTVFAAAVPTRDGRARDQVAAFTYGYGVASPEMRIARKVAASRGLKARELVVQPYLLDRMDEVHGAVEGFQALSFSRQAGVSDSLSAMGQRVVGGHWGDVWFDTAGAFGDASSDLVELAHGKFAKRGRDWLLDHLCAPHLEGRDPENVLRDLLRDEITRLPDLGDSDFTLKVLKTEQWSFRWTLASIRAYRLGLPTMMPFYANEVVDFFLTVPTEQLPGRRLQIAHLRRLHSDLAAVRWQATGLPLRPTDAQKAGELMRRALRKAGRTVTRRRARERNWEVQYFGGDRPARLRGGLSRPGSSVVEMAGASAVVSLLDEFSAQPDAGSGYVVDALLTLQRSLDI